MYVCRCMNVQCSIGMNVRCIRIGVCGSKRYKGMVVDVCPVLTYMYLYMYEYLSVWEYGGMRVEMGHSD